MLHSSENRTEVSRPMYDLGPYRALQEHRNKKNAIDRSFHASIVCKNKAMPVSAAMDSIVTQISRWIYLLPSAGYAR